MGVTSASLHGVGNLDCDMEWFIIEVSGGVIYEAAILIILDSIKSQPVALPGGRLDKSLNTVLISHLLDLIQNVPHFDFVRFLQCLDEFCTYLGCIPQSPHWSLANLL